jgi:hypothetical protein
MNPCRELSPIPIESPFQRKLESHFFSALEGKEIPAFAGMTGVFSLE